METEERLCLKFTAGELVPNVSVKQEAGGLGKNSQVPGLAEPEFIIDLEHLQSIKTEQDSSDTVAYTFQRISTDAEASTDGYEYTIRVLTSEEEFLDEKKDSGSLGPENNQYVLPPRDDKQARVSASDKETEIRCALKIAVDQNSYKRCELCDKTFPKESIRRHLRWTHCERSWKCELCPRSFKSKFHLKTHTATHAKSRKRKFACHYCDKACYTKGNLLVHMQTHLHTISCQLCGSRFMQQADLATHMLRKHSAKPQQFSTGPQTPNDDSVSTQPQMGKNEEFLAAQESNDGYEYTITVLTSDQEFLKDRPELDSEEKMQGVVAIVDGQEIIVGISRKESETYEFTPHTQPKKSPTNKRTRKRKLSQSIPDKDALNNDHGADSTSIAQGSQPAALTMHDAQQAKIHISEKNIVTCEICNNICPKEFIEAHVRRAHCGTQGSEEYILAVDTAGQATVSTAEDAVVCKFCSNICSRRLMELHMRLAHYKCEFCPRVCKNKVLLSRHRKIHDANRRPKYACEQCGRKYQYKQGLEVHMMTHVQEREIKEISCQLCAMKYLTENGLRKHEKTHTGDTYNCEVCGLGFIHKSNLHRHTYLKHMGETTAKSMDIKTELASDEEFIDEDSQGSQQHAPDIADAKAFRVSSTDPNSETCKVCHKIYPKKLIKVHMDAEHECRTYKCETCSKVFTGKQSFNRHREIHDSNRQRKYGCDQCALKFFHQFDLKRHSVIHARQKRKSEKFLSNQCDL